MSLSLLTAGALLYGFLKTDFIEVVYNISLISSAQQSDSAIHNIYRLFVFLPVYGVAYGTEYSFLCYTVACLLAHSIHNGL